MNSEQAKEINFIDFILQICSKDDLISLQEDRALFKHPFRMDNNPSLAIFKNNKNKGWSYKDHSTDETGNIIDFVKTNYCKKSISDTLNEIAIIMSLPPKEKEHNLNINYTDKRTNNLIEIKKINPLENQALIEYLQSRKLTVSICKLYLKEVYYSITKNGEIKNYFGVGFENNLGGFEIRNKYSKTNLIGKDITYIQADKESSNRVLLFEGFLDYMSALTYYKTDKAKYDVIVLNSTTQIKKAVYKIIENKYTIIYDYLDNDFAGQHCQIELKNDLEIAFKKKEIEQIPKIINSFVLYQSHNDFNDFLKSIN